MLIDLIDSYLFLYNTELKNPLKILVNKTKKNPYRINVLYTSHFGFFFLDLPDDNKNQPLNEHGNDKYKDLINQDE